MTTKRRFRVYRDRYDDVGDRSHRWCWECTFCDPPARGARHGLDATWRIWSISLRYHMRRRAGHHRWVSQNRP